MADKIAYFCSHRIIVAGIGPGNPDYMVPEALRVIRSAKVLVGGSRALSQFSSGDKEQDTMAIKGDIVAVMDFIAEKLRDNDVVAMVSGDPGYFSLLDALRRYFPEEIIQVIPGISSMQLAFARLALPWHEADLLSFHGRRPAEEKLAYAPGRLLGMLTDGEYNSCKWVGERKRSWPSAPGCPTMLRKSSGQPWQEQQAMMPTDIAYWW